MSSGTEHTSRLFAGVAMAALGLLSVRQMRGGHLQARWTPVIVGGAYVVFAGAALAVRAPRPHFLGFVLLGSLLLGGGLTWTRRGQPTRSTSGHANSLVSRRCVGQ